MNPTSAHMLAHTIEDDHRRDLSRRQLAQAARRDRATDSRSWLDRIRLPRLRLASSSSRA